MDTLENKEQEVLKKQPFSQRTLAYKTFVFYLLIMGCQFVWFEGFKTSVFKCILMIISPFVFLLCRVKFSAAFFFSALYFVLICCSLLLRDMPITLSALYTLGCLCTFSMMHSFIVAGALTYDDAIDLLKKIIYLYTIFLVLQQIKAYTGIGYSPLINYYGFYHNGIYKFNSLLNEPSFLGRGLAVVLFAYLELRRLKFGDKISIKKLWKTDRWVLISAIYTLLFSGSGTAIVALFIILLYIAMRGTSGFILFLFIAIFPLLPLLQEWDPVKRAVSTAQVSTTLDMEQIRQNDTSSAARVAPIVSFIKNFRPCAWDFWIGQSENNPFYYSNIGIIELYGAFAYIGLLLLLFFCCFRSIISIEYIFFFVLFAGTVGNVAYVWFCMMIFSIIKYFYSINNFLSPEKFGEKNCKKNYHTL